MLSASCDSGKKALRKWTRFQDDNNLDRTTVWRAIELFLRAGSEQSIVELSLTEAYATYDIPAAMPSKEEEDEQSPANNTPSARPVKPSGKRSSGTKRNHPRQGNRDDEATGIGDGETRIEETLTFSNSTQATVAFLQPDKFEVRLEDGRIVYRLLLYRKQVEELYCQSYDAMEKDNECEPDSIPAQ